MGNVFAASNLPPASPLLGVAPPPPPPVSASDSSPSDSNKVINQEDLNPGTIEDLHKKCKDIFPVNFEGAKLMVNKGLSSHFQISHTINMSSLTPSGYRFGATYVGTKQYVPTEAYPVLFGDVDPSMNLNANIIHQFTEKIRCKVATQIQNSKVLAAQFTADYRGRDYTASFTAGNPDIVNENGVLVAQYFQGLTPQIAVGAELAYQYGQQVPGGEIAILSLAGKYTGRNYVVSGTFGETSMHVCYYHKGNENISVGVELETNFRLQDSVASIGYEINLPKANLLFKGMVDSNWVVGAVLEKKLQPLPFSFALSGMINHAKNQSRFGIGLIIG